MPVVVPVATVAVICAALFTVNDDAGVPLKLTAVAPVKFVPATTTAVPTGPVVGLKPEIVGGDGITVKFAAEVAVPPAVVTETFPVVVALATVAVICVALFTVKDEAALPLNATAVAPLKLVPVITTLAPTNPLTGLKLEIVGAGGSTEKLAAEVPVPLGVVTEIFPVVAPLGTGAVIWVALSTVNVAAVPLKLTAVAPVKFVPLITTLAPTTPLAGLKLETVGPTFTVKLLVEVAVPPGVVTETCPLVEPLGTIAVIWAAVFTAKEDAAMPLNLTLVAPAKFVPVMMTVAPKAPLAGLKLAMVGAGGGGLEPGPELVAPPPQATSVNSSRVTRQLTEIRVALNSLKNLGVASFRPQVKE